MWEGGGTGGTVPSNLNICGVWLDAAPTTVINDKFGGPQSRSGRFRDEKSLLSLLGTERDCSMVQPVDQPLFRASAAIQVPVQCLILNCNHFLPHP